MKRLPSMARAPLIFLLAAVGLAAFALSHDWDRVHRALSAVSWWSVPAALALVVAGAVASALSWRVILADLGSPIPARTAAQIFWLAQLGKYIPGGIWPLLGQSQLARRRGLPGKQAAAAGAVVLGVTSITGTGLSILLVPLLSRAATATYWPVFLLALIALVGLWPPVLQRLLEFAYRVTRRTGPRRVPSGQALMLSAAWSLAAWAAYGLQAFVLFAGFGHLGWRLYLLATSGFALSWVAGFVVVLAPAGVGVREAAFVAVMASSALTPSQTLVVALLSRACMTVGDALCGLVGFAGDVRNDGGGKRLVAATPVAEADGGCPPTQPDKKD